jgi:hypothetical protein
VYHPTSCATSCTGAETDGVRVSLCLSVCLSVCLPACLPACLSDCLRSCICSELQADLRRGVWETIVEVDDIFVQANSILLENIDKKAEEERIQKWMRIALRADKELPPNNTIVAQLKKKVYDHRTLITTCSHIANAALKDRHWEAIEEATGATLSRQLAIARREGLSLGHVLKLNFLEHSEQITQASLRATQEQLLEDLLAKVKESWKDAEFTILEYKDQKDLHILGDCEEIQSLLDESMTTISSILANR